MSTVSLTGRNRVVATSLVVVVAGMVGLAFASVPLYRLFCQVTGYGGTTQQATAAPDNSIEREVVVRLDGNVAGLPWSFRPEMPQIKVRLGETALVKFVAANTGAVPVVGTATFNVQPELVGVYFNKIECFCFVEQKLEPGERVELPVQFFVSPDMAEDRELEAIGTITLSYTFFPVPTERQPVAQATGDEPGKSL